MIARLQKYTTFAVMAAAGTAAVAVAASESPVTRVKARHHISEIVMPHLVDPTAGMAALEEAGTSGRFTMPDVSWIPIGAPEGPNSLSLFLDTAAGAPDDAGPRAGESGRTTPVAPDLLPIRAAGLSAPIAPLPAPDFGWIFRTPVTPEENAVPDGNVAPDEFLSTYEAQRSQTVSGAAALQARRAREQRLVLHDEAPVRRGPGEEARQVLASWRDGDPKAGRTPACPPGGDPSCYLRDPAVLEALGRMSPNQIRAISVLISTAEDPAAFLETVIDASAAPSPRRTRIASRDTIFPDIAAPDVPRPGGSGWDSGGPISLGLRAPDPNSGAEPSRQAAPEIASGPLPEASVPTGRDAGRSGAPPQIERLLEMDRDEMDDRKKSVFNRRP